MASEQQQVGAGDTEAALPADVVIAVSLCDSIVFPGVITPLRAGASGLERSCRRGQPPGASDRAALPGRAPAGGGRARHDGALHDHGRGPGGREAWLA